MGVDQDHQEYKFKGIIGKGTSRRKGIISEENTSGKESINRVVA